MSRGKRGGGCGWRSGANEYDTVSPLDLLKNPMILIAVVALGLMFGMPYLMDNSTSTIPSFPLPHFPHPSLSPHLFFSPLFTLPLADKQTFLPRSSGPGDEEGIRRTAEEEHLERGGERGESVAKFRHGGVDGGQDVWGE